MIETIEVGEASGRPVVTIRTDDGGLHVMEQDAIGFHAETLGFTDAIDALEAALMIAYQGGGEVDPSTGENPFTAAYTVLEHRERARSAEARCALAEGRGDDPRSPKTRAALAARKAVLDATGAAGDRECILEKVRAGARSKLGVKTPRRSSTAGRISRPTADAEPQADGEGFFTAEDRQKVRDALANRLGEISRRRDAFLHELTGEDDDPLADPEPTVEAEPEPDPTTLDGLIARHGGGA